eukprot:TRINITY_DN23439_c0_g1_i1.p1 TRINITY_DN23439_c0_g1~~TRINITY_DN23439_c0_g1_i1.p1  ORF type:complete len:422 (-),score=98.83 TRINITY_DN23439_c0_g1_i1:67-1332(-)
MGQNHSVQVEGTVAPGYESVRDMFEANFREGRETNAQLCVYVGDELVIDLYASLYDSSSYTGDTLSNVFSSTKSLTAICMARMVDNGLLDYNEKISKYWPEFAQNGKGETTVADLMRHEAGLASFSTALSRESLLRENIKKNKVGEVIEKQEQSFPPTQKRAYHAVTRGWIANEVFRRVEPSGATVGEHLQEIAEGLGASVHIGVGENQLADYCPVSHMSGPYVFGQSLIPKALGRAIDPNILDLMRLVAIFRQFAKDTAKRAPAFEGLGGNNEQWNDEDVRRGEIPSANGNCSARGLALVAAAMANGGSFKGFTVLSPAGWKALHAAPKDGMLLVRNVKFTQGGVAEYEEEDTSTTNGRLGYYGWMGYGGSVFQWHPELKIGVGYVPTLLTWMDLTNNKARLLQGEVVNCARKIKEGVPF